MTPAALLSPVFALVALTALVWLAMLIARARRMREAGIVPQDMPSRMLATEKLGDAEAANNALMNLFEIPVLFYALALTLLVLALGDPIYFLGLWAFVALRAAQALIHLTVNTVLWRGLAYLASTALLFLMWARLAWQVLNLPP
jgi:hypothetical protein